MRYREVIHAPIWLLALIYFFFLSLVLSIWAALGNNSAIFTFVVLTVLLIIIYFKTSLTIEVDETHLRVGRAYINRQYLDHINILDSKEFSRIRTRDADPAAYLAIRFWSSGAVQVKILDPRDPTPYWLISTKHGEELGQALKN